jgi:LuxR family maltose regulon positive regulatory protein
LVVFNTWRQQVEAKEWQDEQLQVLVLQALALQAHGEHDQAVQLTYDSLALAEPGGFIRLFVDEGLPMAHLLSQAEAHGVMPDSIGKLLAVFAAEKLQGEDTSYLPSSTQSLPHRSIEPP